MHLPISADTAIVDDTTPSTTKPRLEPGAEIDSLAADVLDAAIEVHRALGPGFLESIYEQAMCFELAQRRIPFARQSSVQVHYKGQLVGDARIDLLVDCRLIIELKAIDHLAPIHLAQAMSYLKATRLPLALLVALLLACPFHSGGGAPPTSTRRCCYAAFVESFFPNHKKPWRPLCPWRRFLAS